MINQTDETGLETFAALPRYQSKAAVRSAICNGGPGLLDDIPGCTGEDSFLYVISNTDEQEFDRFIASIPGVCIDPRQNEAGKFRTYRLADRIYYISGDISTNTLYWMYATFFNKTMLQTYGLEDPYTLVANNEWTVDKMFSMCKEIYTDAGEPGKDLADTFGIVMPRLSIDAFFYSSGLRTTEKGDNGELLLSPSYTGEVSQRLAEMLVELLFDSEGGFCVHDDTGPVNQAFANGQVAFITNRPMDAITDYGHANNLVYGVVPTPKWDSQQEQYLTCIGNPFTLYSISMAQSYDQERVDMLGAVLECMASEAYRKTTPALYEQTMQTRYAKDDVTAQMYDIGGRCARAGRHADYRCIRSDGN